MIRLAALGGLIALTAVLSARDARAGWRYSNDYEGEERSWVGWSPNPVGYRADDGTLHQSPMLLSARISWTLPVLSFAHSSPFSDGGEQLVQLLPSLNLQLTQITQHSAAVLPPSFNPRLIRVAFRQRWWPDTKMPLNSLGRELAFGVIGTIWSHHSNGQYGTSFYDAAGNPTDDLALAAAANRENGDFATNYVGAKVWFRCSRLDKNGDRPERGTFVSVEYQHHHGVFFPGGLDAKLEPIWGRHHLLVSGHYRTGYQHDAKGDVAPKDDYGGIYWLVGGDAWWVTDAADRPVVSSHHVMGSIEAAGFVPKYLGSTGLFARLSGGRNPLNIRFVEDRAEFIFGLMIDTSQSIERLPPGL